MFAAVLLLQPFGCGITGISHHAILQSIFLVLSSLFIALVKSIFKKSKLNVAHFLSDLRFLFLFS